MMSSPAEQQALERLTQELERPLAALESRIAALGEALRDRDATRTARWPAPSISSAAPRAAGPFPPRCGTA
jgi:hypothetical protein